MGLLCAHFLFSWSWRAVLGWGNELFRVLAKSLRLNIFFVYCDHVSSPPNQSVTSSRTLGQETMREVNSSAGPRLSHWQKQVGTDTETPGLIWKKEQVLLSTSRPPSTLPSIPQGIERTGLSKGLLPPGEGNSHLSESYYSLGSELGPLIDIIS